MPQFFLGVKLTIIMKKSLLAILSAALLLIPMNSCSSAEGTEALLKNATDIVLSGATATCDSQAVYVNEEGKITITRAGIYNVSGTLDDGQIYVECVDAGNVNIVLNNATIHNNDGACIVIKKASEATVTLMDGTVNTLSDGDTYNFEKPTDDEPDAVIFSKEDLRVNGNGKLVIDANYSGALYSKDGLTIDSGEIEIDSVNHGIKGKDYLVVNGGTLTLNTLGDGMKSTNYDSELVGYVTVNGGTINITTEDEAIQAVSNLTINGGDIKVQSINNGLKSVGVITFAGGNVSIDAMDSALAAADINFNDACTVTIDGAPYSANK